MLRKNFQHNIKTQVLDHLRKAYGPKSVNMENLRLDFFVNTYEVKPIAQYHRKRKVTAESGLSPHYDKAGLWGAFICNLTGDAGSPGLFWCPEHKADHKQFTKVAVVPNAGDCAFLRRGCLHGVAQVPRTSQRITLNIFVTCVPKKKSRV
jgi:hypothetical protein